MSKREKVQEAYCFILWMTRSLLAELFASLNKKAAAYMDRLSDKQREAFCRYHHALSQASFLGAITLYWTREHNLGELALEVWLLICAALLFQHGMYLVKER